MRESHQVERDWWFIPVSINEVDVGMIFQEDKSGEISQCSIKSRGGLAALDRVVAATGGWHVHLLRHRSVVLKKDADFVRMKPTLPVAEVEDANWSPKLFKLRVSKIT